MKNQITSDQCGYSELLNCSKARGSQIRKNSNSSLRGFCQAINRTKGGEFGKMLAIKM